MISAGEIALRLQDQGWRGLLPLLPHDATPNIRLAPDKAGEVANGRGKARGGGQGQGGRCCPTGAYIPTISRRSKVGPVAGVNAGMRACHAAPWVAFIDVDVLHVKTAAEIEEMLRRFQGLGEFTWRVGTAAAVLWELLLDYQRGSEDLAHVVCRPTGEVDQHGNVVRPRGGQDGGGLHRSINRTVEVSIMCPTQWPISIGRHRPAVDQHANLNGDAVSHAAAGVVGRHYALVCHRGLKRQAGGAVLEQWHLLPGRDSWKRQWSSWPSPQRPGCRPWPRRSRQYPALPQG